MISVIIYTLNEEINLPVCLNSLKECTDIIVVDSFSTDKTCAIARESGVHVVQHAFTGFGDQRNWSFDHVIIKNPWVLILDADERVTPELWKEMLHKTSSCGPDVSAFRLKRRFYWEGKWLKHANLYPSWVVRLVRPDKVRYINRGHAETQIVNGKTETLDADLFDENLKGIESWRKRQLEYARKEAEYEITSTDVFSMKTILSSDPLTRRATHKLIARKIPFRPAFYFLYAFILRNGWKDGYIGLKFCLEKARYYDQIKRFSIELRKSK